MSVQVQGQKRKKKALVKTSGGWGGVGERGKEVRSSQSCASGTQRAETFQGTRGSVCGCHSTLTYHLQPLLQDRERGN